MEMRRPDAVGEMAEVVDRLLASRASTIYELKGLKEDIQDRYDVLDETYHKAIALFEKGSMEKVGTSAAMFCMELTGAEYALVYRYDEELDMFICNKGSKACKDGSMAMDKEIQLKSNTSLFNSIISDGESCFSNNLDYESGYKGEFEEVYGFEVKSTLLVPLIHKGILQGAVQLLEKPEGFSQLEQSRIEPFCDALAIAIKIHKDSA
jgi:hypothetical protein